MADKTWNKELYWCLEVLSLQEEVSQTFFWESNDALVIYQIWYVEHTNVYVKVQLRNLKEFDFLYQALP